jgi:hypothetical protein
MRLIRLLSLLVSFATAALLSLCLVTPSFAQTDRAGLNGTVTDPAGKVIPGVHVVATISDTGLRRDPSDTFVAA